MIKPVRFGVVGVGYLGNFHAQQLKKIENVDLMGVFDLNSTLCSKVANKYTVYAFNSLDEVLNSCDAISIVTPTPAHYKVAMAALAKRCHVFIEKPITHKTIEAEKIITLAKKNHVKLQIGHIERFNPAYKTFCSTPRKPLFIESHRLSPFNIRGSDVAVILDLMIHDIDLVLALIKEDVVNINASGASVVSSFIDLANARLTFKNGVVANLTASRVSDKQMRQIRVFEKNCYSVLDLHVPEIKCLTVGVNKKIEKKLIKVKKNNALFLELESFVRSIITDTTTLVSGEEGLNALKIAIKIQKIIEKQQNN